MTASDEIVFVRFSNRGRVHVHREQRGTPPATVDVTLCGRFAATGTGNGINEFADIDLCRTCHRLFDGDTDRLFNHPQPALFGGGQDPLDTLGITFAPGWDALCERDPHAIRHVSLTTPGIAGDAWPNHPRAIRSDRMFTGGLDFDIVGDGGDPHDVATSLVAALAVAGLHEGLEWVRVDGEQIGDPHPAEEGPMWDWLMAETVSVVNDYATRWPADPTDRTVPDMSSAVTVAEKIESGDHDVRLGELGIAVPANWTTFSLPDRDGTVKWVEIETPGIAPDSTDPSRTFPGGVGFNVPEQDRTARGVAVNMVAGLAASGLHEGLEWVRVGGARLAVPHPASGNGTFDWLQERFAAIVYAYIDSWPTRPNQHL